MTARMHVCFVIASRVLSGPPPNCSSGDEPASVPVLSSRRTSSLCRRDRTVGSSVQDEQQSTREKYLIESMVGGVALFDFDGDGWLDIYLVNGAKLEDPMPAGREPDKSDPQFWNRLYRNNRDGTFTDITKEAGVQGRFYGMGVAIGDYDNDGRPDIYVTNLGRNILYHNNGDGTFTDVTEKAGVAGGGWSTGACWVDFDRDGRLISSCPDMSSGISAKTCGAVTGAKVIVPTAIPTSSNRSRILFIGTMETAPSQTFQNAQELRTHRARDWVSRSTTLIVMAGPTS